MLENMETNLDIAVIGMAGKFPGAKNIDEFWFNLKNGIESIAFFSDEQLKANGVAADLLENPNYVKADGKLENSEYFDAFFFGYTPKEAEIMDPQIRIFHECAWTALEDAGYDPETYNGLIGHYVGATPNFYWEALSFLSGKTAEIGSFAASHLTRKDFLSLRISYKLNLRGPSYVIASTCSTSLVAIHLACQAILNGECDMALAGGVAVFSEKRQGYLYKEGMVLSPDGHCRTFDAKANGLVAGKGAGVVLLKRLEDAILAGDSIYAVIKGSAANNDGNRKAGFTAPSINGQAEVVKMALAAAGVDAGSISYIETHGTGTELGDPVEIEALKLAFNTNEKGFCALGAVKTNVGHLDSAAGITGFIKTVLALKHRIIPPTLHFETANPKIDFDNSPFYVNTTAAKWKNDKYPLRAGVSALGIGGTNVHVVLEQAPVTNGQEAGATQHLSTAAHRLIMLSAKTAAALEKMTQNLAAHLQANPGANLADAAYTLQVGRRAFDYRRFIVVANREEAIRSLSSPSSRSVHTSVLKDEDHPVIFMFPGLGSQYVNMGRDLYEKEKVFQKEMDRCFEILEPLLDYDLKDILYPNGTTNEAFQPGAASIDSSDIAQVSVFILEYALAKLLMGWGIKPHAMIGYSFGEYTAACISGVISAKDALKLIVSRGKLIAAAPGGTMLSVPMESEQLKPLLSQDVSLAIDNGPSCIVAGSNQAIDAFEKQMKEKRLICMRLTASHALHSQMMEPILTEFAGIVGQFDLGEPQIPYISNVTGEWITVEDAANPAYWAKHLRQTVRFAEGIGELSRISRSIFVEIGPGRDLSALVSRYLEKNLGSCAINLIRPPGKKIPDDLYLLDKVGRLWLYGQTIDWRVFYHNRKRRRISMPTYPFEGKPYVIDENRLNLDRDLFSGSNPLSARKEDIADWFYVPQWLRSVLLSPADIEGLKQSSVLVFTKKLHLAAQVVEQLERYGADVTTAAEGQGFHKVSDKEFLLNPREFSHYEAIFNQLGKSHRLPDRIIHLWGLTGDSPGTPGGDFLENAQYSGFYSLLYLTRALVKQNVGIDVQMEIVANHLCEITGEEILLPEKSTILGPPKVIPQEYPFIACRVIDVDLPKAGSRQEKRLIEQLLNEFTTKTVDTVVAYRGNYRWVQAYSPVRLEKPREDIPRLRKGGVYLITGGLGNFGLILARYLAQHIKAKLVLTARSHLPGRDGWSQWLATHPEEDAVSSKIREILEIEKAGGEVLVCKADAADLQEMEQVIRKAEERFGQINGVIHAAGVVSGKSIRCPIEFVGIEECEEQFGPKVYGLLVLAQVLENKKPDFCLLTSSLSPILGGLGFFSYSAANSFMDTFVYKYNRENDIKWMSVNWEGWRIGEQNVQQTSSAFGTEEHQLIMSPAEVFEAFQRVLCHNRTHQIIITPGELQTRIDKWVKLESLRDETLSPGEKSVSLYPRPGLSSEYLAPRNETERELTRIWQDLLGYEQLGVRDDFFELGGDSLKAITLLSRIQKELNNTVSISDLFDNPTIEEITTCLSHGKTSPQLIFTPVETKEYYPLSSSQRGFYFGQQLEVNGFTLNMAEMYIMEGKMDRAKLGDILEELIKRHESLRTSFQILDEGPIQRIHDIETLDFVLEYYKAEEGEFKEIHQRFLRPFDLAKAPLFRAALVDLGEKRCSLMVDMHHIISDGVSHEILIEEFFHLYNGKELPEIKFQYKDFSHLENKRLESGELEGQKDYWLNQFETKPPILNLPTDYPGPLKPGSQTSFVDFSLEENETLKVKTLAIKEEVTLFILFMAVYNILLSILSGKEDIIVVTITAGRIHVDLTHIIGAFVNPLPLRNFPGSGKSFRKFLREVRNTTLRAFENQDYPFEKLAEKLGIIGRGRNDWVFEVGFSMQNFENNSRKSNVMNGLEITQGGLMHFDRELPCLINLEGTEAQNRVFFRLYFHPTLFAEDTILKFCDYFKRIITCVLEEPGKKIAEIKVRSTTGREMLEAGIKKTQENIIADFNL